MAGRFLVASKSALVAAAALMVLVPAFAGAQTSAQTGCIVTMNKSGTKVAKTQGKENSSCVKARVTGKTTDTVDACIVADSKGKLEKAKGKTVAGETKKCVAPLPPYGYTGASTTNTAAVDYEIYLLESIFSNSGAPVDDALNPSPPLPLTPPSADQLNCQATASKIYEKLAATRAKEFVSCKSSGFKLGSITGTAGLTACLTSDSKGKVQKAREKITKSLEAKCATLGGGTLDKAFPGCATRETPTSLNTPARVSECLATRTECNMCLMLGAMDGLNYLEAPCDQLDDGDVNGSCWQCPNGVVDPFEQCDPGNAVETQTCNQNCTYTWCGDGLVNATAGELCDDGNNDDGDGCEANCTHCGDGVVQAPEECDDGNRVDGDGCDQLCRVQDVACPTKGELTLLAGVGKTCANNGDCVPGSTCDTGLGRCVSGTELDTGWTGIAHDADINDQVVVTGDLVCPGPAGPQCGQCDVVGIEPDHGFCRCAADNRVKCDQPFQVDTNDCGNDLCVCYFGPPLPLSSGNTPACVLNQYAQDISGTANVDTGAGRIDAKLASIVYLGESTIQPCPVCGGTCTAPVANVGKACGQNLDCDSNAGAHDGVCGNYDPVAGDGVRGGLCFGGQNNGLPCDVDAESTTFPAPQGGGSSLDCKPSSGLNVSGTGLRLALSQTTGNVSLGANVLCGYPPLVNYMCPCGLCTGDSSVPCTSDADCSDVGGTCERTGGGVPSPNQCDDGICSPTGGGEGICNANLADRFCDGIVRADGKGFIQCQSDADCAPVNIGVAAGNCTLTTQRECFLDPIDATGVENADTPLGVAVLCIPPTANGAINSVAGLPGPGRIKNQAKSRLFCAQNLADEYTPGIGCP